ncbi:hypothetical protein GWR56_11960 [Mucilaginibacter sp. 14171R-50]|uniref:hypothetical protein n=1 Tax=Mucilaginibacter sp. 14171R-50 TaxID=2703789 RepID=UPI00138C96D4|nr:hypothetical protein [Mucilaginibacter sp. 14171R-50]QHS56214.1 hypothetical protein GWR56_11960 [Mucilaginibacter sp. 14171R-50]
MNVSPLIAAEGYFFCLETKEAKIQVSKKASLPHKAITPQTGQNHELEAFASRFAAHIPRFSKIS